MKREKILDCWGIEKYLQSLVGTRVGTRLKKPRRRSACDINIDLKEMGWEGVDLIRTAQDRE
jgi:hypothetical protein